MSNAAGPLRERVIFQKKGRMSDGGGGTTTDYADQFTVWAGYTHMRGGESVLAARLAGQHTQVIRVRRSSRTLLATTDWRIKDKRTGEVFNVRDITPSDDRAFLDMLCQTGVAT